MLLWFFFGLFVSFSFLGFLDLLTTVFDLENQLSSSIAKSPFLVVNAVVVWNQAVQN